MTADERDIQAPPAAFETVPDLSDPPGRETLERILRMDRGDPMQIRQLLATDAPSPSIKVAPAVRSPRWTRPVIRVLAIGIIGIAMLAGVGQVLQITGMYRWSPASDPAGMPINTAVTLCLVGASLLLIVRSEE